MDLVAGEHALHLVVGERGPEAAVDPLLHLPDASLMPMLSDKVRYFIRILPHLLHSVPPPFVWVSSMTGICWWPLL